MVVVLTAVSGCSVQQPSYNPVLGGFPMPNSYLGQSVAKKINLSSGEQSDLRARPKDVASSLR
jgi:hypothetical protein